MNQDEQHLDLLSIFHYIVGGLSILMASVFIFHIVMGVLIVTGKFVDKHRDPMGWIFIIMGSLVVTCGWTLGILIIVAGRKLKKRESRTFCLVIAALECLVQPFGMVLGIFTIIVLMRETVIPLFENKPNLAV